MNIMSILFCFVPLFVWGLFSKILEKETSVLILILSCLTGILSVVPISFIQFKIAQSTTLLSQNEIKSIFLRCLILNGIIEETIKTLFLFFISAKKLNTRQFVLLSVLSGLTLAGFENVVYMIAGHGSTLVRIATSVVIHGACSGLCGVFVYSVKKEKLSVVPFVLAVLFHGIYDYFAGFRAEQTRFFYFSIPVILFAVLEARIRYVNYKVALAEYLNRIKSMKEKAGKSDTQDEATVVIPPNAIIIQNVFESGEAAVDEAEALSGLEQEIQPEETKKATKKPVNNTAKTQTKSKSTAEKNNVTVAEKPKVAAKKTSSAGTTKAKTRTAADNEKTVAVEKVKITTVKKASTKTEKEVKAPKVQAEKKTTAKTTATKTTAAKTVKKDEEKKSASKTEPAKSKTVTGGTKTKTSGATGKTTKKASSDKK